MPKLKRRLNEAEIKQLREMMEKAPQGRKPTVRQLAKFFGVNQPSILKSLGAWEGIHRNRPMPVFKPKMPSPGFKTPKSIEPFTFSNDELKKAEQ